MLIRNQILFLFVLSATALSAQMSDVQIEYINRYKDIAIREMERTGIPASIKLAQGLLESNAGQSDLARRARNHFGMKCGSNWQGDTMYKEDDDYDENGRLIKSCFRVYRSAEASYVAHSEFLRDPRKAFRYGFLFRLDPFDYKAWAYGLKRAGYATSPTYPEKLITLIERYQLYQYDKQTLIAIEDPTVIIEPSRPGRPPRSNIGSGILRNNDVGYVLANEGETLDDIARRVEVSVSALLAYNENLKAGTQPSEGQRIYVQPKRNAYRGKQKYHVVKPGETMMDISQEYAVKLSKLLERNRLVEGQQPAAGEKIKLRGWCKVKVAPRLRDANDPGPTTQPATTAPTRPNGELDMEEPEEEFIDEDIPAPPPSTNPPRTNPPSPPVNPNTEQPKVIINPGSRPVSPPPGTGSNPPPAPPTNTQPAPPPITQPTPPTPTPPASAVYHTVQAGETLWAISQRYGTTVDAIKQLNGLTSNNLSIGMKLRVK
ncbi:MAG: LysM peptidoglycan-binding domain-containing protein [Bacteroidetes bacterium]|nr:MAG: LysM peptidoglycan-binding domain-containing protein [Bacteroidota bacterium]